MTKKQLFFLFGMFLLLIGFFLAFIPHTAHALMGLNSSHTSHIIAGAILLLIGIIILIFSEK